MMAGQFAGTRTGQDSYPRIATAANVLLEASATLPFEPMYQSLLPFLPPSIVSGGGTAAALAVTGSSTDSSWSQYPDRLDLKAWQGDDVQIPLYFQDPSDPTLDMSEANGWTWKGQIRLYQAYNAPYVAEFVSASEFIAPVPPDTQGQTLVTLFLPRQFNNHAGVYSWELMSTGPFIGPVFPPPANLPANEPWPPTTQVKTWLYGYFYCVSRVTQTDWLPPPATALPTGVAITVTPTGTYGPNGRVP